MGSVLLSVFGHADAGSALRFDGTNAYVRVAHAPALDTFPLTITAWVKTLRNAALVDGIVTKYQDGSFDGYALILYNGTLYAFYSRPGGNQVFSAPLGLNGGFIADGHWHHIAFSVAPTGGQLFVDGNLIKSLGWAGVAGSTSSTEPLQIGRYHTYPNTFQGEIDEVTLWNRTLLSGEINYLKHRRLSGAEDGLLGYWRFDEGSGATAKNTASDAFHGTIVNGPAWVESHAAVALEPVAANCLKFDGVSGHVEVADSADLNAYPLTASAWFRTTNGASVVQGIVGKYADGSGNGWTIVVQNGRLRALYLRSFGNIALDVTSAASVADGGWHHSALVVDASGGRLYLDGTLIGSSAWPGPPGAPTSTEPLQIGRYHTYPNRFVGAIDEIALWNRALTAAEVLSLKNLPLAGSEAGLVGYWQLDEGTGTTTADASGSGHTGTLLGNPVWTGSTAYLGDGSVHLIAAPGIPKFTRQYAVTTVPGKNSFTIAGSGFLRRFYDFGSVPPQVAIAATLDGSLQVAGSGVVVPVKPDSVLSAFSMAAYNASSPQPVVPGGIASISSTVNLEPDGAQLDSIASLYEAIETLTHTENGGAVLNDGSETTGGARLLHFNGTVLFGPVATVITDIANTATASSLFPPTYLQSPIQVNANGGHVAAFPAVAFGGGAPFTVNLGTDGTATNVNGVFKLSTPGQFFESAGIRYQLPGTTLGPAGMTATSLLAWFPTGFGMTASTNNRILLPYASKANIVLDGNLLPNTNNLVFTAASYNTNLLYFSEETKPLIIGATQIEWHIPQGEFYLSQADSVEFVREQEDADLFAQSANLVDPLAADRVSNDGYYRHVTRTLGAPVYIRPNTKGAALLTMWATLQENEFRPHFPYMNRAVGGHIPVVGGTLIVADDLIDGASHLLLAGPAPAPYARDCGADACSAAATTSAEVLSFTASPGELGLGQFDFTPEGGLLAYGTIPPENLTWGFAGGSAYAQRTSDVTAGAYYISGTFLRANEFAAEQDARRPVRMLLTGYGSSNGVTYVERPDQANYADGFANYAGLNFRAPVEGRSVIANTDTGPYPLTARSKYYVRFGGVSGIHESASFPENLRLYGYPFTFQSYRLSFLDSVNIESRTDGVITLPVPSGFPVEFERMKFLCRGNLDSARLPANIDTKHLVYWNTDLKLLSLQFKPASSDACSLTERYLVLGVETRLPFIPQPLHAALAIKSNGNLATVATKVEGADSRFAVPANLQLQGPGGSYYPITTAGEGYFNNWETPGRPDSGFYTLAGRIRVPFFRDIKTQFHVTPTGPTTAQVNLMGGWAAEEGLGANRGWNNGTENYFNKAKFDPTHDGWPAGVSIASYRNSPDEQFRQRAQQNWIDVAIFDYPLAWNAVLREFSGFSDAKVILPVIDVNSRLKEVSPGKVDFDFAQDINLQLPRIKVLDFANDALNEVNAPITTISNAIRAEISAAIDTTGLTRGIRSLQNLMRENAEGFFRPVLEPALDPVVENLYASLSGASAVSRANLLAQTPAIVRASSSGLQTAIMSLNGTVGQANSLFGKLDHTLSDVDDTLGLFLRVLEKDGGGNRHVVRAIIQKLADDQGPALGFAANLGEDLVNGLVKDIEPTLAKIESEMLELRSQFDQVRKQVGRVTLDNDFADSLDAANHTSSTLQAYLQLAGTSVSNLLSSSVGPAGDYLTADATRAKREIRERLTMAFLGSPLSANYQTAFRQFLYDKNFLLNQLMDVLFDQVNRSIRDGLSSQIAGATDGAFQGMKGAGAMSGSLLSAKIRGAPTFEGDSLRKIHLDSEIKMNLPDEMKFTAYMDIKELNSQSTALSCIPPGAPAAEVTLGAKDVPLDWLGVTSGGPLALNVEARWTLQSGAVLGVGGSFEVIGKVGFKGCSINNFGASIAIGQVENYFAAKAGATVTILGVPVDFNAGIFAGHACSLDPLRFIDPEVAEVLIVNATEFSGIYLQFGAGISLSDILFGSSSCLLDVSLNVQNALYYQGGPRFGSIGGRQKEAVSVDLICIISADASWATGFRLDSEGKLTLAGKARLCGKIGACPFCLKACATLGVTGTITDGGIDYSIDY